MKVLEILRGEINGETRSVENSIIPNRSVSIVFLHKYFLAGGYIGYLLGTLLGNAKSDLHLNCIKFQPIKYYNYIPNTMKVIAEQQWIFK